jgi:hypothetical protein
MATEVEMGRRQFAIEQMYKKYLGREPEAAGLEYWMNSGEPLESVEWNIANSPEGLEFAAATELDVFEDTTADDTTADTTDDIDTGERLYDYTNQREDGGSQNLYWNNYTRQVTASELEELYNAPDNSRVREAFGTFDNYMAYMDERQDLIEEGEYKADWWDTGVALIDPESLGREGGMDDRALEGSIIDEGVNQAQQGYQEQEDVFTNLYEKYTGESVVKYLDNGAKYEWNGTSFVMTQEAYGPHVGSIVGSVIPAIVISAGLGPAGANVFGAGAGAGASRGAISAMLGQYISTGSVDPRSVAQSAALGGIGGFFDDIVNATPGTYGGWVVNGEIVGAPGQFAIEKIQYLSRTLGIPFDEAAGIVEGILIGTVNGEDLEGIAINAVGGWGDAKVNQYVEDALGNAGLDVDNFFREGSTNISTEALQSLVSNGIQGLVSGGMSETDVFKTFYDYFDKGGSLDFLLPGLLDLDVDFDALSLSFPDFKFDFCEKFPQVCNGTLEGFDLKSCGDYGEGEQKPWYCDIDVDLTGVDVDLPDVDIDIDIQCPEGFKDENGNCIPIDIQCPEGFKNEEGECLPIDIGCPEGFKDEDGTCVPIDINCPEGFKYSESQKQCIKIVCPEGFKNEAGECVPIDCPTGFRYDDSRGECIQIPKLNCKDLNFNIPNSVKGQTHTKKINEDGTEECIPDVVECIEGFDFDGQTCVEIKGPEIGCEDKQIPNGVQKFKKNSLGECIPDVVECIEGFDFDGQQCVEIKGPEIGCEDEQIPNGVQKFKKDSLGNCIPDVVECIEGFDFDGQQCVEITLPCPPTQVRNEQTGKCECPEGQEENAFGLCVDPDDSCPTGQQRDPETGECVEVDVDTPDVDTPDVDIDFGFTVPQQPITDDRGMFTGTAINQDAQLLTRTEFPIRDFLAEALPKPKQNTGMMTGFKV